MTARLAAERLTSAHRDQLLGMHADHRLMATLGGTRDGDQTDQYLARNLDHWDRHGFGIWMLHDRADGAPVGRAGLRYLGLGAAEEIELAYALVSHRWGRGLGTEIATHLVQLGLERLGAASLIGLTLPANLPSQRVLLRVGFRREGTVQHGGAPHLLFRITGQPPRSPR